ncbi:hypothetical protein [Parapedobacter defluvii]|nr:hypothetical protein [Parapedobacter defluvii]
MAKLAVAHVSMTPNRRNTAVGRPMSLWTDEQPTLTYSSAEVRKSQVP